MKKLAPPFYGELDCALNWLHVELFLYDQAFLIFQGTNLKFIYNKSFNSKGVFFQCQNRF